MSSFELTLSYAVVLWELLTGERPFGGLNLFVVAYGVGQGTLSLPIPDGCPKPLETLMKGVCIAAFHIPHSLPSLSPLLHTLSLSLSLSLSRVKNLFIELLVQYHIYLANL